MRLVIAGVPHAGKTTYANHARWGSDQNTAGREFADGVLVSAGVVRHTDDLVGMPWSEASAQIATWFDRPGPWIVEGVRSVHALRKWLNTREHDGKPCDRVIWLGTPRVALTPGQATMAKGVTTVWHSIRAELLARNVQVEES